MLNPAMLRRVVRCRAEAEQLEHSLDMLRKDYAETLTHAEAMVLMGAAQSAAAAGSVLLGVEWGAEDQEVSRG